MRLAERNAGLSSHCLVLVCSVLHSPLALVPPLSPFPRRLVSSLAPSISPFVFRPSLVAFALRPVFCFLCSRSVDTSRLFLCFV